MLEHLRQYSERTGHVLTAVGAGADLLQHRIVSNLTVVSLSLAIISYATAITCNILKERREARREAKARARGPAAGLTFDQLEARGQN